MEIVQQFGLDDSLEACTETTKNFFVKTTFEILAHQHGKTIGACNSQSSNLTDA